MRRHLVAFALLGTAACSAPGVASDAGTGATALVDAPALAAGGEPATTCTGANACSGRLTLSGTSFTLPYFSTAPLEVAAPGFSRLVVFIEGLDRDAKTDFTTMVTAGASANALGSTLVVTPEFQALTDGPNGSACLGHVDTPAPTDLLWACDEWSDGLFATNAPSVSAYGALDALLTAALDANPTITRVVVSGFSAGGQFAQRYVAANGVDGKLAASFRYVVGDPSSYLYLDARRPVNAGSCTSTGCPDGYAVYADAGACPGYNSWKYGTEGLEGAAAGFTPAQLVQSYVSRSVTYLLGTLDDGPTAAADVAELDTTCAAEAQGAYRYQRGLGFYFYVKGLFDAGGSAMLPVVGCAHGSRCVFQSDAGVGAVFGE